MVKADFNSFMKKQEPLEQTQPAPRELPEWVKVGVKLAFEDHIRLKHVAASDHSNLQRLIVDALNMLLESRGLPHVKHYNERPP